MAKIPFQAKVYIEERNSFVRTNHSDDLLQQKVSFVEIRKPNFGPRFSKQPTQVLVAHEVTRYQVLVFLTSVDVESGLPDSPGHYLHSKHLLLSGLKRWFQKNGGILG